MTVRSYYIVKNVSGVNVDLTLTLSSGIVVADVWRSGEVCTLSHEAMSKFRRSLGWSRFEQAFEVREMTEKQRPMWTKEGF